jgi:hypothetical protein
MDDFNPFLSRDIIQIIMDILWMKGDIDTLLQIRHVNTKTHNFAKNNRYKYYINHYTLIHYLKFDYRQHIIDAFHNNTVKLLDDLGIFDTLLVDKFIGKLQFSSNHEIISWKMCLDELIPDHTVGGNFQTYYINNENHKFKAYKLVNDWVSNTLKIFNMSIENALDLFHKTLVPLGSVNYWGNYKRYHMYDVEFFDNPDEQFTLLLNKIKCIYFLI